MCGRHILIALKMIVFVTMIHFEASMRWSIVFTFPQALGCLKSFPDYYVSVFPDEAVSMPLLLQDFRLYSDV